VRWDYPQDGPVPPNSSYFTCACDAAASGARGRCLSCSAPAGVRFADRLGERSRIRPRGLRSQRTGDHQLSYAKARLRRAFGVLDPEGRIRTGISPLDRRSLYQMSYFAVVPEVWRDHDVAARWPKEPTRRETGRLPQRCGNGPQGGRDFLPFRHDFCEAAAEDVTRGDGCAVFEADGELR
jgi:hypothetical protein